MNPTEGVKLLTVTDVDGQRLDNFLSRHLKGVPKSRIYRLIRKGEVRVNSKRCRPDQKLTRGDAVRIPPIRLAPQAPIPKPRPGLAQELLSRILAETDDLLVVSKPAGLSVHGGSGVHLGLVEALRQLKPEWSRLELGHRLDRDTSGCIVLVKTPETLRDLHHALRNKNVYKQYTALVLGNWPENVKEIDAPLERFQLPNGERRVKVSAEGKGSLTRIKVLERFGQHATLIEAIPVSGRTHQIRVHCQHLGHPICGDPKYAFDQSNVRGIRINRLCLHSRSIAFRLAASAATQAYSAPLDDDFEQILNALRGQSE